MAVGTFKAKADTAAAKGAAALIVINDPASTSRSDDDLERPGGSVTGKLPVYHMTWNAAKRLGTRIGVPFLMDIPVIGYFFRQLSRQRMENSIVAIVSARVMRTPEEDLAESIRRRQAFERAISRTFDVRKLTDAPYAVLLETTTSELLARKIALGFEDDGYPTRVTEWELYGERHWDVYLTEIESFQAAGDLANQLLDADWNPRITVLPGENEFAVE